MNNINLPNNCFETVYVSTPKITQNSQKIHYYIPGRKIAFFLIGTKQAKVIDVRFAEINPASDPKIFTLSASFFPLALVDKIHLMILDKMELFAGLCLHEKTYDHFITDLKAIEIQQKNNALEFEILENQLSAIAFSDSGLNEYGTFLLPNKFA